MPKKLKTIRWTVELAASEFQIDRRTLSKRIRAGDIRPGSDGKLSTEQICAAVFGDYRREQLREIRERANKLELENQCMRGERIPLEDVAATEKMIFGFIRGTLLANHNKVLTQAIINEIFDEWRARAQELQAMADKLDSGNGQFPAA